MTQNEDEDVEHLCLEYTKPMQKFRAPFKERGVRITQNSTGDATVQVFSSFEDPIPKQNQKMEARHVVVEFEYILCAYMTAKAIHISDTVFHPCPIMAAASSGNSSHTKFPRFFAYFSRNFRVIFA